jgi:hypothetical protein
VLSTVFIFVVIVGIFAFDMFNRWWRENEWRRRWRDREDD